MKAALPKEQARVLSDMRQTAPVSGTWFHAWSLERLLTCACVMSLDSILVVLRQ